MKDKKKKPADINVLAASIVKEATEEPSKESLSEIAKTLGRLGGLKGGPARAEKLSAKKRKAIAVKAAKTRWGNKRK